MDIKIIWVGKTKNPAIKDLVADYLERIEHLVTCEIAETRDVSKARGLRGSSLVEAEASEIARHLTDARKTVALDGKGKQFTSPEFASWFESEQNRGTRGITFVIGGPEGLSSVIADRAELKLSLGKMTWTHDICRLLLVEQIYRAFGIMRNIPYHK